MGEGLIKSRCYVYCIPFTALHGLTVTEIISCLPESGPVMKLST